MLTVIIVAGDTVHLLWNGEEEKAQMVPDQYHNAKAFSHLQFWSLSLSATQWRGPLARSGDDKIWRKPFMTPSRPSIGIAEDRFPGGD